jgi:hypothetical protein
MKGMLRNHPKMRFRGASSWPPHWGGASDPYTSPVGEQGTLKAVELFAADNRPARLSLTNEYRGRFFSGNLWIDDTGALPTLFAFLRSHVGEELSVISGLEVDL